MDRVALAELLLLAEDAGRKELLREHSAVADVELAYTLKDICQAAWRTDPTRSIQAATALTVLSNCNSDKEIGAYANWAEAVAALVKGQMESAVSLLDDAETALLTLGRQHKAAATQLAKTLALAMLGRYDEAIDCGLRARDVFLAHGDQMEAGRIENNIGNLYFRREQYKEAETLQSIARERFVAINNQEQLAIINNCLANTHALLHKFDSAEALYKEAVQQAEAAGLNVTLAEIEGNIGNFSLLQGRYDRALDYLERARRRYASLRMDHQSAIAEQEIADAYLELNLAPEAAKIYAQVVPKFAQLGMRAEQARASAFHARAQISLGQIEEAHKLLRKAADLYVAEGNNVGVALVNVTQAQLLYIEHQCRAAYEMATSAAAVFAKAGVSNRLMFTQWLQGESARCSGATDLAFELLKTTLATAESEKQQDIAVRCHSSLGLLSAASGDERLAERSFRDAITLIEDLRAPLPAEEFRAAFFSDKLVPYHELVRLCLRGGRTEEAFVFTENARSRALADSIGVLPNSEPAKDEFEAQLIAQTTSLREELNYLYGQQNRLHSHVAQRSNKGAAIHEEISIREDQLLEITRQLQHRRKQKGTTRESFSLSEIQRHLGSDSVLVEYTTVGNDLIAFVVTGTHVKAIPCRATEPEVSTHVKQFRFQIDTLRHGGKKIREHLPLLTARVRAHLEKLYEILIRPIESTLDNRRLIVVPHRSLHYLPFQALFDGSSYLIENREVGYAPSAMVLQHCLKLPRQELKKAVLFGVADETIPSVSNEIKAIEQTLPQTTSFVDQTATVQNLMESASEADILHLACHGHFRSDNPLFSSLRLSDGWFTVRDAYQLRLKAELVTLSACDTGTNSIAPGEELIGLARGFFSAGSTSILLTLWSVDDATTAELMASFYREFVSSKSAATALRTAQIAVLREKPHPFFWSPFALVGRW